MGFYRTQLIPQGDVKLAKPRSPRYVRLDSEKIRAIICPSHTGNKGIVERELPHKGTQKPRSSRYVRLGSKKSLHYKLTIVINIAGGHGGPPLHH